MPALATPHRRYALTLAMRGLAMAAGFSSFALILSPALRPPGAVAGLAAMALPAGGWILGGFYSPLMRGLFGHEPGVPGRGASWAGALTGAGLASLFLALLMRAQGHAGAPAPLLALGISANIAYLPAKLGCLAGGCCRSVHAEGGWRRVALPAMEMAATLLVLALALALWRLSEPAAIIGACLGHGAVRTLSARERGLWLGRGWPLSDPGFELFTLALIVLLALLIR